MLKDGSKAWEIKNFLVQQDRCEVVTIEGKDYYGKGSPLYKVTIKLAIYKNLSADTFIKSFLI